MGSTFMLNKKPTWITPFLLLLSALLIFGFAATLDDFLHVWDERYHALVAKNMIKHPFKPMLYADLALNQDYSGWYKGHIWLHKQPLFMWQMALSMKVFGVSVLASRIPSVIMSSVVVLALFRSGTVLHNRYTGFFAATFMLSSFYWFNLVAGRNMLDTNDVAFLSYVSLSFWAFIEYQHSKKWWWLPIIGLLSGAAILCKWLTGLLIFAAWGIYILLKRKEFKSQIIAFVIALAVCVLTFLPWQLYTAKNFPAEFEIEQNHNIEHLFEPLSFNEEDDYFYYVNMINKNYDISISLIFLLALYSMYSFSKNRKIAISFLVAFAFQFIFFSIAQSKMPSFAMAGWFIVALSFGYLLNALFVFLNNFESIYRRKAFVLILVTTTLLYFRIDILEFEKAENAILNKESNAYKLSHNKSVLTSIKLPPNYVLFNVNGLHIIEAMFYTDLPAYNHFPTEEQIDELHRKNRKIAVIEGENNIPEYIKRNPSILVIEGFLYVSE